MNTQFITTTQLREQSSKVVSRLFLGEDITLVHRSKIIGVIKPLTFSSKSIENLNDFQSTLSALKPKTVIPYEKRKKIYTRYLKKRYGQGVS